MQLKDFKNSDFTITATLNATQIYNVLIKQNHLKIGNKIQEYIHKYPHPTYHIYDQQEHLLNHHLELRSEQDVITYIESLPKKFNEKK